jgi:hypothetical protein
VAECLRELANIAIFVAEYFDGDVQKVGVWFELQNPMLGNISPRNMIRCGRYKRLLNFVLDAREAENAAWPVWRSSYLARERAAITAALEPIRSARFA